jgi:threonine/homoserine/homoserine lactone efflux protein
MLLPVVGTATLAWMGVKALRRNAAAMRVVKFIGALIAAPFIGLAFILALPYLGAAALVWIVVRAWTGARALIGKAQTG